MNQLGEDTNFENFSDLTSLNFDKWLSDEINNTGGGCQKVKTSYQLMIAKLGNLSTGRSTASTAGGAARARNSTTTAAPHNKPPSTEAPKPPSKAALVLTSKDRMRKVQRLGQVVGEKLLMSSRKRNYYRSTKKSKKTLLGILTETSVGNHMSNVMDACQRAVRQMEYLLFTNGGAERLLLKLEYFRDRPLIL